MSHVFNVKLNIWLYKFIHKGNTWSFIIFIACSNCTWHSRS